MTHKVFFHEHHNCLTLCACAIVHPIVDIKQIWHDHQLYGARVKNGRRRFIPKKRFFNEEISEHSGLDVHHFTFSEYEDFENELNAHIKSGYYTMVPVDTYYLPYSKLYKDEHNHHWIVVWNEHETSYSVIDHYYNNDTTVDKSITQSAVEGFMKIHDYGQYQFYTIETENYRDLTLEAYIQVLEENISLFMGNQYIGEQLNQQVLEDAVIISQGLSVFFDMYASIEEDLQNTDKMGKDEYESYYEDFLDISHARYVFSEFLESFEVSINKTELIDLICEISQDYRLCSNYALKSMYDGGKSLEKMLKRLKQIEKKEKDFLKLLTAYLVEMRQSDLSLKKGR